MIAMQNKIIIKSNYHNLLDGQVFLLSSENLTVFIDGPVIIWSLNENLIQL